MSKKLAEELIIADESQIIEWIESAVKHALFRQFLRDVIRDSYLEGVRKTREGCAEAISEESYSPNGEPSTQIIDLVDALAACLSYHDELEELCKKN